MLYVTFKENTKNITAKRACGAGSFFVACFFLGFFCIATHPCTVRSSNCRTWRSDKTASLL